MLLQQDVEVVEGERPRLRGLQPGERLARLLGLAGAGALLVDRARGDLLGGVLALALFSAGVSSRPGVQRVARYGSQVSGRSGAPGAELSRVTNDFA